jgi:hypothetical protein
MPLFFVILSSVLGYELVEKARASLLELSGFTALQFTDSFVQAFIPARSIPQAYDFCLQAVS